MRKNDQINGWYAERESEGERILRAGPRSICFSDGNPVPFLKNVRLVEEIEDVDEERLRFLNTKIREIFRERTYIWDGSRGSGSLSITPLGEDDGTATNRS